MYFCVSVYIENTRVNNGISTQHHTVHSIIPSMISDKFFYNIEEKKTGFHYLQYIHIFFQP